MRDFSTSFMPFLHFVHGRRFGLITFFSSSRSMIRFGQSLRTPSSDLGRAAPGELTTFCSLFLLHGIHMGKGRLPSKLSSTGVITSSILPVVGPFRGGPSTFSFSLIINYVILLGSVFRTVN